MSVKYGTVGYLSKCSCRCASYCWEETLNIAQVTFRMPLSKKITITAIEVVRIQVCFLTIGSKYNNKRAECHVIFIPFKGQIYSKQGSHVSVLFCTWTFSIFSHFFSFYFPEVSTVSSDLINFVDVQRLHENIKWIMYF